MVSQFDHKEVVFRQLGISREGVEVGEGVEVVGEVVDHLL